MFEKLTRSTVFPALMLILANVLAFALLFLFGMSQLEVLYIIFGTLALFLIMYGLILYFKLGDKYIMMIATMLVTFGVIMLTRINPQFAERQVMWVAVSTGAFFASYFIYLAVKSWHKIWWFYIGLTVILFALTMIFGDTRGGSRNWIGFETRFLNFTLQPSELMKILFVMFLACHFSGNFKVNYLKIPPKFYAMLGVYIFLAALVMQREWGTAVLLFGIYFLMSFTFEFDWKLLTLNSGIAVVGLILGHRALFHIQTRFAMWVDPWSDPFGRGYQILRSLFAVSSGGYFGAGIGNGLPNNIPEVHTDFIFAAIVEEMGIFGGVAVILLFFLLCYRCFKIALTVQDSFNKAVAMGIAAMFGLQTFIIVGGVINLIPLTGITLPFISYGGSSMVVSFAALGVVQAISSNPVGAGSSRPSNQL